MVTNLWVLFMFMVLSTASIYLLIKYRGNRLIYWVSIALLCGALAGMQIMMEKELLPYMSANSDIHTVKWVTIIAGILNFIVNTVLYWVVLVFFLIYNNIRVKSWLIAALSIPIVITFFFYTDLSTNRLNVFFIAGWGVFYVISSGILALRPIWIEKERTNRLYHSANAMIMYVPLVCLNIYQFLPSTYSDHVLAIIPIVNLISVLIIISLYIWGSYLGVQRKALQQVHMGTTLFQHSVKNSISKVKLNAINIRKSVHKDSIQDIDRFVDNILHIHADMMRTISQITTAVSDKIQLNRGRYDLSEMVDEVVKIIAPNHQIHIIKNVEPVELLIDKQLVTECLLNICHNAIEAMTGEGSLLVQLEQKKRAVILKISDTGHGMNTIQLQNVCEPFYSTKHRTGKNFGLGMFQVKKVMEAHNGKVIVTSKLQQGTTVRLIFKRKRVAKWKK